MKKSLIFSVIAIFAIIAVACQPQVVTETVVQTQIVEKVVEKVVEVEKKSTCEKPLEDGDHWRNDRHKRQSWRLDEKRCNPCD